MRRLPLILSAVAAFATATAVVAQIEGGERGVAPVDSSSNFEVSGIRVDVAAPTADAARYGGWRIAQRKAWTQLSQQLGGGGAAVPDGTLDQLVAGIVIEREEIGPQRYVARLGVLFDRGRAGALLGVNTYVARSSPTLVVPVQWSGGVGEVFEGRSQWQQAWARFRTGNSTVDYVRPSGTGPDSLLLTYGQTGRPGRGWWRAILDQYGASDVVIPVVRITRQWPGGPVIGAFEARHGPDNRLLGSFSLRVGSAAGLPQLLDAGVARIDALYQAALRSGALRPDASLSPPPTPVAAEDESQEEAELPTDAATRPDTPAAAVTVQYDSPGAGAVSSTEALLRGIPGVRTAVTTSLALGGISVMRVTYEGDPAALRTALEARGLQVLGSGAELRIRRAPQLLPPDLPTSTETTG